MHQHRTAEHASFMKFSSWSAFLFPMKCGIMEMIVFVRDETVKRHRVFFRQRNVFLRRFPLRFLHKAGMLFHEAPIFPSRCFLVDMIDMPKEFSPS